MKSGVKFKLLAILYILLLPNIDQGGAMVTKEMSHGRLRFYLGNITYVDTI